MVIGDLGAMVNVQLAMILTIVFSHPFFSVSS